MTCSTRGPDPAVRLVVVVADDPAGVVAARCRDGCDAAVATVAEDLVAGEQVCDGVAGDHDVVAVARASNARARRRGVGGRR